MTDRPILYSAPMVRACLEGRKTQTRRLIKQPFYSGYFEGEIEMTVIPADSRGPTAFRFNADAVGGGAVLEEVFEPRINAGDRLWAREEFSGPFHLRPKFDPPRGWPTDTELWYWADGSPEYGDWGKPKPGMHLPRWGSRFTQVVIDVRVQRLQDITEEDAIAEGIEPVLDYRAPGVTHWKDYRVEKDGTPHPHAVVPFISPVRSYESLWESINGAGSWKLNPWVVAYTVTTGRVNIDAIPSP